MRAWIPDALGVYATRLTHAAPRVEDRLHHYVHHMPQAIASFGPMRLAAFGFGCTGSSYVAGCAAEDRLTAEAQNVSGVAVVTAAQAIRRVLDTLGAKRIALVSPYPESLAEAGYRYWRDAGIEVAVKLRVDPKLHDTHQIYELTSGDALSALRQMIDADVDCLVASGTGMPTLRALQTLYTETRRPTISSNLCLAWCLTRMAAPELAPASPVEWLGSSA